MGRTLAAIALLLTFPGLRAAQAEVPVAKPQISVGDRWTYRRTDSRTKPPMSIYEMRVTFVDAKAIHAVLARQGKEPESDGTWTSEWNGVVSVDEGVFETSGGLLRFPLQIGAEYRAAWQLLRPRMGKFRVKHERTVRVMGWEEVAVPAGSFRAVRLQAEGSYQRLDKPVSNWARNVVWYAPEVKRWVKWSYEDGSGLKVGEELVFYRLQ